MDVADDDLCALGIVDLVVGAGMIGEVLNKIEGVHHLADVVEEGTYFGLEAVAADTVEDGLGDVGDLKAVLEGAGRPDCEVFEQGMVGIEELDVGEVGGESEDFLKDINEGVGDEGEDDVEAKQGEVAVLDGGKAASGIEAVAYICDDVGAEDDGEGDKKVGAVAEAGEAVHGRSAATQLDKEVFKTVWDDGAAEDCDDDVAKKSKAGVEECR